MTMIIKEMVTSRGRLRGTISVPAEVEKNTKNAAALDGCRCLAKPDSGGLA